MFQQKKKKKKLILLVSGVIFFILAVIGGIFWWVGKKQSSNNSNQKSELPPSPPSDNPNNPPLDDQEEKVKQLKSQLTQIKNELNKSENSTKKVQYSSQLTEIENKLKNLSQQNNQGQKETVKKVEQEIKTINQELKIPEKPDDPKQDKPNENPKTPEENSDCPYLNEANLTGQTTFDPKKMFINDEELAQWRKIPRDYIVKLWKKGYHWVDIIQLWEWKIPELEVPDLKTEKRVGVINELSVMNNPDRQKPDKYVGSTQSMVVIMRKISGGGPIINIDKGQTIVPGHKKLDLARHTKKIVNLFLEQEKINPADYQICILDSLEAENFNQEAKVAFGKGGGKSADSAVYLALLSAFYQKPISRSVATTGALSLAAKKAKVNQQEFTMQPGTNRPIKGLKWKTQVATEKGVSRLVLSKYQTAPLWSRWDKGQKKWIQNEEDYQQVVPAETKAKIKKIYWTENITELKSLLLENKLV